MPNPYGVPEISVQILAEKRANEEAFILLDVREPHELQFAELDDILLLPLSLLAEQKLDAIPEELEDKDQEIVVMCHTGRRSAQVTAWLLQQGWTNVFNLDGGIEAYALEIDPDVGHY